ncbi:putative GPI-anchored protein [Capsicum annuum]|nr:putative GPI-anchored protein [Capsicum annuum]
MFDFVEASSSSEKSPRRGNFNGRIFPSNLTTLSSAPKFNLSNFSRICDNLVLYLNVDGTGITPYANLNHYDLPQALQNRYNGWLHREVVKDFADYADFCFKMFQDRVKNWFLFNEPRVIAALVYDTGNFAPERCYLEIAQKRTLQVSLTLLPIISSYVMLLQHKDTVKGI